MKLLCGQSSVVIPLTIASHREGQVAYDIRAQAGYPAYRCDVVLTIASGIRVGTNGSGYAIDTNTGWAAGTTITIINNGYIEGAGGYGNGGSGFHAIHAQWPVSIDNTNGYIRGGGGGGAQGTGAETVWPPGFVGGGGGGGGAGNPGGAAGTGESAAAPGADGSAGNRSGGGPGGPGGDSGAEARGGDGGGGGSWGEAGTQSGPDSNGERSYVVGSAGKAVDRGFNAITWLGGYNSTQVKPYPVA